MVNGQSLKTRRERAEGQDPCWCNPSVLWLLLPKEVRNEMVASWWALIAVTSRKRFEQMSGGTVHVWH
jgi:hypothetical protein